jgi:hypothetical protein
VEAVALNSEINKNAVIYSFTIKSDIYLSIDPGSTIEITFPIDYNDILPNIPSCDNAEIASSPINCNIVSNTIILTNYFSSTKYDWIYRFRITNIKNPGQTGRTGSFSATIKDPNSATILTTGGASILITEGQGDILSYLFLNLKPSAQCSQVL